MEIDIELFKKCLLEQKYSESSIHSYIVCLNQFYNYFKKSGADIISFELVEKHVNWLIKDKEIGVAYQKQILTAIQKYHELVLNQSIELKAIIPKNKEFQLPNCLCKIDVRTLIDKTENIKHKVIICLLYSGGLRLSELLNLTIKDIDIINNTIHIKENKDLNDRIVNLSPVLIDLLPKYYLKYKPKLYVIEGRNGEAINERSVQKIIQAAGIKAGIKAQVTPRCLRHCFATHLLENGTDIQYVQELLGHKSIKTTENYNHTSDIKNSKIKSPLDLL